jgi:hypothetical protein
LGYVALVFIVSGLALQSAIEFLQSRIDAKEQRLLDLERRARTEWQVVEREQLTSISLTFNHRVELSVTAFMDYLSGVVLSVSTDRELDPDIAPRNLRFARVNDEADLEMAYALTASDSKQFSRHSDGVSFYRAATEDEMQPAPSNHIPEARIAPNDETQTGSPVFTKTGHISAVTQIVAGGEWGYTTSNQEAWTDPQKLVCGVYASFKWADLQLGASYRTIADLGHLHRLTIALPNTFNLRPADEFQLTFFGSRGVNVSIDLARRRFALREDGGWETGLKGSELYTALESDFFEERMRKLTGFYDDLAAQRS